MDIKESILLIKGLLKQAVCKRAREIDLELIEILTASNGKQ